jgi:hypothetical protein
MDKAITEFSTGLMIWQIIMLVIIIGLTILFVKIYFKLIKYLDLKTEYLKKKLESK